MNPVVREAPRGQLFAESPPLMTWSTLGSFGFRVHVDSKSRYVFVERRRLWKRSTRTIPFRDIEYVHFDPYSGSSPEVSLVLKRSGGVVPLLSFGGTFREVVAQVGFILVFGVLVGFLLHALLSGEDGRTRFASRLGELVGVGLSKPVAPIADADGVVRACEACGRPAPPNKTACLYCGGELQSVALDSPRTERIEVR